MARIHLLDHTGRKLPYHVSRARAQELVQQGFGAMDGRKVIRLIEIKRSPLSSGQGKTYESAGADKFPRFFSGGLTRNEHKPAPIQKFKAARVPH